MCKGVKNKLPNYKEERTLNYTYIGCDIRFFIYNIKRQLKLGWTFNENRDIWHKDHSFPCKEANFNTKNGIIETFSWWNLQPLSKTDNLRKGGRVI
jgi:hypothetical protein